MTVFQALHGRASSLVLEVVPGGAPLWLSFWAEIHYQSITSS
jgi:hypothetical protein